MDHLSPADFVMTALDIKPGKQVGEALKMLLECVTETPELNTREGLLAVLAAGPNLEQAKP